MPELPDLTIFAKNLRASLLNQEIIAANVHNLMKVNASREAFQEKLVGSSVSNIRRDGKEMLFETSNGNAFSVHLMLAGRFTLSSTDKVKIGKSFLLTVGFADGQTLIVSDQMKMCKVTLNPKASRSPDVLSDKFTFARFASAARRNDMINVKEFLITQSNMRGIGNAYADEILYRANISPANLTGKIPQERMRDLYEAIITVLTEAIASIEAIAPDIISGEERSFLTVHSKEKTFTERGEPILKATIAGKTTYYTGTQQLF